MFVCSLIMAIAVEHSGFHHRLSLSMISAVGTSQRRIFLSEIFLILVFDRSSIVRLTVEMSSQVKVPVPELLSSNTE